MGDGSRDDRTVYIRNIDSKVTEEILFELFLQAGPLVGVKRPKDPDGNLRPFAFVEFEHDISPPYARSLMDGIQLFGRSISVQFRSGSRHEQDSRGNSPQATPPYRNGSQSPAPNGRMNMATPPAIQRSMSAPQGFQGMGGAQGQGLLPMPPAQFMGGFPMQGFIQGGLGLGLMQMPVLPGGQPMQPFSNQPDQAQSHQYQRHTKEHQRSDTGRSPHSHHRDSHHHGSSSSSSSDRYRDDRYRDDRYRDDRQHGQHSDERRHDSVHRHHSHHHREGRRDHPYQR